MSTNQKKNKNSSLFQKVTAFIGKDTHHMNESKKPALTIRIIILSILLYFTLNILVCHNVITAASLMIYICPLLLFSGIFVTTYYWRTTTVFILFVIGMLCWIYANLIMFGWNIGVQHFLLLLLILLFFSFYEHYLVKTMIALGLLLIRIVFYIFFLDYTPKWQVSSLSMFILQTLNSLTIFWCISIVAYVFSKDSHELEGKLIEYNNLLQIQANTDALTGLPNRRHALKYMEELVQKQNVAFSICICDIDFFKKVNDTYGHDCGDEALCTLSKILKKQMVPPSMAARWGGEEFLLLFPDCNGDDAYVHLQSIRNEINSTRICCGDVEFCITVTFGLAEYDFQNDLTKTLAEADQKLYIGKEQGRNRIIF